jgi:hypothetical protein
MHGAAQRAGAGTSAPLGPGRPCQRAMHADRPYGSFWNELASRSSFFAGPGAPHGGSTLRVGTQPALLEPRAAAWPGRGIIA